jgi:hypothetical protein
MDDPAKLVAGRSKTRVRLFPQQLQLLVSGGTYPKVGRETLLDIAVCLGLVEQLVTSVNRSLAAASFANAAALSGVGIISRVFASKN